MNIKAGCKFDKETIRALTHISTYKKANPRKKLIAKLILSFFLLAVLVVESSLLWFDPLIIVLIFADILVIFLDCFMYFIVPVIQYKALVRMKNLENEYLFSDDALYITTCGAEFHGETRMEYSVFVKVFETSRFFFIYQTKNQVYPVDKSTLEAEQAEVIRNKLQGFVKKQYKICKY